jgi:hypothetical protein
MIHRIQDNEGRLKNVTTTNTNEDDDSINLELDNEESEDEGELVDVLNVQPNPNSPTKSDTSCETIYQNVANSNKRIAVKTLSHETEDDYAFMFTAIRKAAKKIYDY